MNEKPSLAEVLMSAHQLSDADLHQLLAMLRDELKHRYKRADQLAALQFTTKDWVEMTRGDRKLPTGAKGHVVEIRREFVSVHFPDYGMFSVAASALRKIDPPAGWGGAKPQSGA